MRPSLSAALALALTTALAAPAAHATTWDAAALAAIPTSTVGAAHYFSDDGSELILSVIQDRTGDGSMGSSSAPGHQGLWLGQDGLSSRYLVLFNLPITRLSMSFVGLTAAGGQAERLTAFDVIAPPPFTISFDSPDGSASYAGGDVLALGADGKGRLDFVPATPVTLSGIAFTHDQPAALGGFVITRVEVSPVPEPAGAAAWLCGIASLGASSRWRRRSVAR